jgi:hypothetical protein
MTGLLLTELNGVQGRNITAQGLHGKHGDLIADISRSPHHKVSDGFTP